MNNLTFIKQRNSSSSYHSLDQYYKIIVPHKPQHYQLNVHYEGIDIHDFTRDIVAEYSYIL